MLTLLDPAAKSRNRVLLSPSALVPSLPIADLTQRCQPLTHPPCLLRPTQVTPLHTDPHANLLCQAVGRKYVRLYSPACTAAMYPHPEGMHSNSSQVDAGEPDLQRFPLFGQAPFQGV